MLAESNFWSLLGMLAAVVLILLLAWWTARWMGSGGAAALPSAGAGRFRVVRQIAVGRNERLLLVRIGESCCLVGVTEHAVTLLKELEGSEAGEWLEEQAAAPSFLDAVREALRKQK